MKPASRFKRFLAYLCDFIVIFLIGCFLGLILGLVSGIFSKPFLVSDAFLNGPIVFAVAQFIVFLYFVLCESSRYQATLGKKLFKLYVATNENKRISFMRAVWRVIAMSIPAVPYLLVTEGALSVDPVYKLISLGIAVILQLIWFIPILFKARKGVHDMLSKTMVLARK